MRILVTGRDGQLARSLLSRGADESGLRIEAGGRPELDLERPDEAAAFLRRALPDVVVNAAAYTAVDQAEDEPERARLVNAVGAGALAEAAREIGARFVQVSTDYVFDGQSTAPYGEEAIPSPSGVYGATKLEGEERVRGATPDHLIVRTAWVYSPWGRNFVRTMLQVAKDRDEVRVVADQRGNPTSALDLADAILGILRAWKGGSGTGLGRTYHVTGAGAASWAEFAEAIFAEAAALGLPSARVVPIATADWPTRAARPANSQLDGRAFARDFGFAMPSWRDSLRAVVRRIAAQA